MTKFHHPPHSGGQYPAPADYGPALTLKVCAKCHAEDADRSPLFRAHSHSIRVLTDFGHMPPKRALTSAETVELKAWLDGEPAAAGPASGPASSDPQK